MIKNFLPFLLAVFVVIASCNQPPKVEKAQDDPVTPGAPVETKAPNSPQYKPAFEGQTRAAGVKTETALDVKVLTDKLVNPWGIVSLPDGRLLITEKAGTMRIATVNGEVGDPITGLPKVNDSGQGGLLGINIDPDFPTNRMVYWSYSEDQPDGTLTAVAKGRLADDEKTIETATVIYRAFPAFKSSLHYGSRIVFDKDGNMFVSTGERSDKKSRPQAQQLNSALGKIVHITKDGQPVSTNLFIGRTDAKPEIYTFGHRNTQGLAINPATGDLWNNEFGPRGGDEVNIIKPGKDYGWPAITYGIEYSGETIGEGITQKEGMEQPVYYWDPVISPSGMAFYNADLIPEWKNNLFIGCLSGMHIARLVIKDNKVVGEERLLTGENQRFRDVTVGKDGALYAVCDGKNGRLYRVGKK